MVQVRKAHGAQASSSRLPASLLVASPEEIGPGEEEKEQELEHAGARTVIE